MGECQNDGVCVQPNKCQCSNGWAGNDCTIPVCMEECQNDGVCVQPNKCQCSNGWTGNDCTIPILVENCTRDNCSQGKKILTVCVFIGRNEAFPYECLSSVNCC